MKKRTKSPTMGLGPRNCAACGKQFQPYRNYQIACSRSCRERTKELSPRYKEWELICKRCGSAFKTMWSGTGHQPSCLSCTEQLARDKQERQNAARRPGGNQNERTKDYGRTYNFGKYGITPEEFEQMLQAQKGLCYLCNEPAKPGSGPATQRLHIDHDHETGKNRKLLCNNCNRGLGYLQDDPELLRRAADYIERFRTE